MDAKYSIWLNRNSACVPAMQYVQRHTDPQAAWDQCPNLSWMTWLLCRTVDIQLLADQVDRFIQSKDARPSVIDIYTSPVSKETAFSFLNAYNILMRTTPSHIQTVLSWWCICEKLELLDLVSKGDGQLNHAIREFVLTKFPKVPIPRSLL